MPTYIFTGGVPRVMCPLIVGPDAVVSPAPGHPDLVPGQTVILRFGDTLTVTEPYPHPELTETEPPETVPAPPADESVMDVISSTAAAYTPPGPPVESAHVSDEVTAEIITEQDETK